MNKQDAVKQEIKDVRRNYTRTPNILFESYPDIRPQEKWLYINLVYLCGAKGTRHLSLRYIHDRTGISLGALSGSKDPEKNDPGMIRRLHNAGLIHAEIKKKKTREGKESDQAQYHITIVDLWQLNESFFHECSENEHFEDETPSSVQIPNASVQKMNTLDGKCSENERERSFSERERSENDTNIRLHSKITKKEITNVDANAINNAPAPSSLTEGKTTPSKSQPREKKPTPPKQTELPKIDEPDLSHFSETEKDIYSRLRPQDQKIYLGWLPEERAPYNNYLGSMGYAFIVNITPAIERTVKQFKDVQPSIQDFKDIAAYAKKLEKNKPKDQRFYSIRGMKFWDYASEYVGWKSSLEMNESDQPNPEQGYSLAGYKYKPEEAKTPDLPFAGPLRLRNKKRGA